MQQNQRHGHGNRQKQIDLAWFNIFCYRPTFQWTQVSVRNQQQEKMSTEMLHSLECAKSLIRVIVSAMI